MLLDLSQHLRMSWHPPIKQRACMTCFCKADRTEARRTIWADFV